MPSFLNGDSMSNSHLYSRKIWSGCSIAWNFQYFKLVPRFDSYEFNHHSYFLLSLSFETRQVAETFRNTHFSNFCIWSDGTALIWNLHLSHHRPCDECPTHATNMWLHMPLETFHSSPFLHEYTICSKHDLENTFASNLWDISIQAAIAPRQI